jgi:putative heme-binding domain-containing protein
LISKGTHHDDRAWFLRVSRNFMLSGHWFQFWASLILLWSKLSILSAAASPSDRPTGLVEYQRYGLLHEGDVDRGNAVFNDDSKTLCSHCHSTDGTASKAGPDLFAIGDKFGRREIIDSILTPSATIAVGYASTTVETKSGEEFTGIVKEAGNDEIALMGGDGKLTRFLRKEIVQEQPSEISLMPEGLQSGLSLEEFADLIEFLVSLKQPENSKELHHGMPSIIPAVAKEVELKAIHGPELKFEHPVWLGPVLGETNVFLVVEHETGNIWRLDRNVEPPSKTLFVNLERYQKGTRGLIGLVLHPHFEESRKYYYAKHTVENGRFSTWICEREASADLKTDSGKPSIRLLKMEASTGVHYGGGLQFGPDGYLYIGMGDTGPQEDPNGNAQNTGLLLGKMLRIDVDHKTPDLPYSIPADNPFVGQPEFRPEIWAYGFREPWRFSFDRVTGDLWVGDVGQDRYEEVDVVHRGENYGWNVYEGFEPFSNRYRKAGATFVPPVFAYGRKFGPSVTGGFVYRGNTKSAFYGVYILGDYQSRRIFGLTQKDRVLNKIRQLCVAPQSVVSFGCDLDGEIYVVGYEGTLYKLELGKAEF